MSTGVVKVAAWMPVSDELAVDTGVLTDAVGTLMRDALFDYEENRRAEEYVRSLGLEPMRHRPGRAELREIQRPMRVRANIRRNLASLMANKSHFNSAGDALMADPHGSATTYAVECFGRHPSA